MINGYLYKLEWFKVQLLRRYLAPSSPQITIVNGAEKLLEKV